MYSFQIVMFERAVLLVVLLASLLFVVFDGVEVGWESPMAFSNAARAECSVEPA